MSEALKEYYRYRYLKSHPSTLQLFDNEPFDLRQFGILFSKFRKETSTATTNWSRQFWRDTSAGIVLSRIFLDMFYRVSRESEKPNGSERTSAMTCVDTETGKRYGRTRDGFVEYAELFLFTPMPTLETTPDDVPTITNTKFGYDVHLFDEYQDELRRSIQAFQLYEQIRLPDDVLEYVDQMQTADSAYRPLSLYQLQTAGSAYLPLCLWYYLKAKIQLFDKLAQFKTTGDVTLLPALVLLCEVCLEGNLLYATEGEETSDRPGPMFYMQKMYVNMRGLFAEQCSVDPKRSSTSGTLNDVLSFFEFCDCRPYIFLRRGMMLDFEEMRLNDKTLTTVRDRKVHLTNSDYWWGQFFSLRQSWEERKKADMEAKRRQR